MVQARACGDLLDVQFSISVFAISSSIFHLCLFRPSEVHETWKEE